MIATRDSWRWELYPRDPRRSQAMSNWPWRPTPGQEAELTRMGFTLGENVAWVRYAAGFRGNAFIWYPATLPTPERYGVDLTGRASEMVCFDDPITAAVWLLTEISNGTPG